MKLPKVENAIDDSGTVQCAAYFFYRAVNNLTLFLDCPSESNELGFMGCHIFSPAERETAKDEVRRTV